MSASVDDTQNITRSLDMDNVDDIKLLNGVGTVSGSQKKLN